MSDKLLVHTSACVPACANRLAFGLVCFRYDSFIIDALVSVENSVLTLFQNCISGNW